MKYFKDPAVGIRAIALDGTQDYLIGPDWVRLSEEDALGQASPAPGITAAVIAARRYEAEVGGITLNGLHINTDDRSKLLINGAALEAMLDPAYTMQWKTPAGFVELAGAQVLAVARAVRAHVQACFDREAELLAAVADSSITDQMLQEGWP